MMKRLDYKEHYTECFQVSFKLTALENFERYICFAFMKSIPKDEEILLDWIVGSRDIKDIRLLVKLLNKITPTSIEGEFIKYKALGVYLSDLVLLNWLRMCYDKKYNIYPEYYDVDVFFKALRKASYIKDPLQRLFYANNEACVKNHIYKQFDHSNYQGKQFEKLSTLTVDTFLQGTFTNQNSIFTYSQ